MRKNIFDLMTKDYEVNFELRKIRDLFEEHQVAKYYDGCWEECSLKQFIDQFLFAKWKHRGIFLGIQELESVLGISEIYINYIHDLESLLTYIEFVKNMINLLDIENNRLHIERYELHINKDKLDMLNSNMITLVNHFGFEFYEAEEEKIIVVHKKEGAIEVAETLNNDKNAKNIIRYNHYLLKGDIQSKREILTGLAHEYEALRKDLESTEYKPLVSDLGYLFNNLNIRHNNIEGSKKQEYLCNLDTDQIEELYDTTYDLFLNFIMIYRYLEAKPSITNLKKVMPHK